MKTTLIHNLNRREAINMMLVALAGTACTPLEMVFSNDKPNSDRNNAPILDAFIKTIIPGIQKDNEEFYSIYYDLYYPFYPYEQVFAKDLCHTSKKIYGISKFEKLPEEQRQEIVEKQLNRGGLTSQLYSAAIWLAQIYIYTGNYHRDNECSIIDFKCSDQKMITYSDTTAFLGEPATIDGNLSSYYHGN